MLSAIAKFWDLVALPYIDIGDLEPEDTDDPPTERKHNPLSLINVDDPTDDFEEGVADVQGVNIVVYR